MLDPEARRLYSQIFSAPDGFVFDCAAGTTFSLDLESLLFAKFCIATGGAAEPESALSDPVGLLEAIHRTARRVTVFCHAGETNVPAQPHSLYALLERSIIPARGKAGGALFHPKVWAIRFTHHLTGEVQLRVAVLSRNLTTSRAWDTFLCLEGSPERARKSESADLAGLLLALPDLAQQPLELSRRQQLELLADEAHRTLFAAPEPFVGGAEFLATGFGRQRGFAPTESGEKVLAISPFVSSEALRHLRELAPVGAGKALLVGRPEEMAKCEQAVVEAWDTYALSDAVSSEADTADLDVSTTADAAPQGLHAKVLAVEGKRRTIWWFGSGNLTNPVRNGTSVELMVRLEGKNARASIQAFLDAGWQDLLESYTYRPALPDPQDSSRSLVDATKELLAHAALALHCQPAADSWQLRLTGIPEVPAGVEVLCRPLSLPGARALHLHPKGLLFDSLSLEALTALFCFHVVSGVGEARFETELTLKLPLEGLPEERDASISRSIIKDRTSFLRYLHCLLASVGGIIPSSGDLTLGSRSLDAESRSSVFASGLLEQLLKTLHQEPERLRGLRSLLERVREEGEGTETVVPEEFRALWAVIEPHLPGEAPN